MGVPRRGPNHLSLKRPYLGVVCLHGSQRSQRLRGHASRLEPGGWTCGGEGKGGGGRGGRVNTISDCRAGHVQRRNHRQKLLATFNARVLLFARHFCKQFKLWLIVFWEGATPFLPFLSLSQNTPQLFSLVAELCHMLQPCSTTPPTCISHALAAVGVSRSNFFQKCASNAPRPPLFHIHRQLCVGSFVHAQRPTAHTPKHKTTHKPRVGDRRNNVPPNSVRTYK